MTNVIPLDQARQRRADQALAAEALLAAHFTHAHGNEHPVARFFYRDRLGRLQRMTLHATALGSLDNLTQHQAAEVRRLHGELFALFGYELLDIQTFMIQRREVAF